MSRKNNRKPVTKAADHPNELGKYLGDYQVYPKLTGKLDDFAAPFDQATINEIVLWKVARYVELSPALMRQLDNLRALNPGEHKKGKDTLEKLLAIKGVRLPMASTILRFANPRVFQIFDRHIYRAIYGKLYKNLSKKPDDCLPIYFNFLGDLRSLCMVKKIDFEVSDRILFEFDKAENPPLSSEAE
ncbi:MAG: hypothetical protein FJW31_07400 [Acidobacteria bacterium]|nr:hypothetical protein [Acidobacteriota bacterium]